MTIGELKDKHFKVASYYWGDDKAHTEISIQFAIDVLEEFVDWNSCGGNPNIKIKIQELKQYLDAKV